jgi:spermidine/putrescine transport system substrate-binding protein
MTQESPLSIGRREFLIKAGLLGLSGPALLAACGGSTKSSESTTAAGGAASGKGKKVSIASWPYYIENDQAPKDGATIKGFTAATGYDVDYQIAVADNVGFTEKVAPDLKNKKPIGYDVVVLTSWACANWIKNGWAAEIPAAKVPNKKNLLDRLAKPDFDTTRKFTMPYALGQVGIAYYPEKVGFEIKSFKDFLKPELKGKTTLLSEMRDSVGLFLLSAGVKPETATVEQMMAAVDEIKKYRDQGQFKKITGNDYTEDLDLGDTWAAVAWSGDVAAIQEKKPELKWVLPSEGAMSFVDTFMIPKGADVDAGAAWINYLYDPKVSGPLFEAISYASPVKGAGDSMTDKGKNSPLVNPDAKADIHEFRTLTEDEAAKVEEAFAAATQQ